MIPDLSFRTPATGYTWSQDYILFPFRMVQIEFGSMADWGVKNMKRMVSYLPIMALAIALPVCACAAGNETHYYGPRGQYQGRATTNTANPSQQSVYDSHGNYRGRVMTGSDGTTRAYDQHGNYLGRGSTYRPPTSTQRK